MEFFKNLLGLSSRPSRRGMVKEFLGALQQAGLSGRFDEQAFAVDVSQNGGRVFLENLWLVYSQAPVAERAAAIQQLVSSVLESSVPIPDDWAEARIHVLPKVRPRSYWSLMPLRLPSPGSPVLPFRALSEFYGLGLCYDLPSSVRDVDEERLGKWGITFEDALAQALDNLRAISQEPFVKLGEGLYRAPWDDSYAATRVLLPEILGRAGVRGQVVASIPNRDTLLLAGSEDLPAIQQLFQLAEAGLQSHHSFLALPLLRQGDRWQELTCQATDPLFLPLQRLRVMSSSQEYGEQKHFLDKSYQRRKEDIFVASVTVLQAPDESLSTLCVWTQGVVCDLPRTDKLAFVRLVGEEPQMLGVARWEAAFPVLQKHLREMQTWPPRFRCTTFPSAEEFSQIQMERS